MANRAKDWMAQAQRDLEHARKDAQDGYHEHACFEAQQAAEKAVKSVYISRHADAWGHHVSKLLLNMEELVSSLSSELLDDAKTLDQYYISTRYPNGFETGAPMDFFTEEQACDAVRRAEKIIRWCEGLQGP